jgi:hypothetical protein
MQARQARVIDGDVHVTAASDGLRFPGRDVDDWEVGRAQRGLEAYPSHRLVNIPSVSCSGRAEYTGCSPLSETPRNRDRTASFRHTPADHNFGPRA